MLYFWANLHSYQWPNNEKYSSHLVTLVNEHLSGKNIHRPTQFRQTAITRVSFQDLRFPAYKVKPAYLRIYNDSTLKYSARVNYDVACPMHFEKYPVDTQRCNISFESWGHTNHFIELTWLREKRIFSSAIALAQFDLDVHFIEDPPSSFSLLGKTWIDHPWSSLVEGDDPLDRPNSQTAMKLGHACVA